MRSVAESEGLTAQALARAGQRRGDEVSFLCPAHDDEHPSASWNPTKGVWHCFACGTGGGEADLAARLGVVQRAGPRHRPPGPSQPQVAKPLPPMADVQRLFEASRPIRLDDEVAAYLIGRGIDPVEVDRRPGLARALARNAPCPRWATKAVAGNAPAQSWAAAGYRLLVPLFTSGRWVPVSVRARRIIPGEPKSIAGRGLTTKNLVMADALGRCLLATRRAPADWPTGARLRLAIAEGEIDFLSLATWWPDEHPSPAVWGIVSGSWTADVAACVPPDTLVEIRTDPDHAGDRLAEQINASLGRRCEVVRVLPKATAP